MSRRFYKSLTLVVCLGVKERGPYGQANTQQITRIGISVKGSAEQ